MMQQIPLKESVIDMSTTDKNKLKKKKRKEKYSYTLVLGGNLNKKNKINFRNF